MLRLSIITFFILGLFACKEEYTIKKNSLSNEEKEKIKQEIQLLELGENSISIADSILSLYPENKEFVSSQLGNYYFRNSDFQLAEKYFSISANNYKLKKNEVEYAKQLANLGVINEITGKYNKANENYLIALTIFNATNLELQSSMIYNNLGIVHQQLEEDSIALQYYRKSLIISQKLNRDDLIAKRLNNIGTIQEEFYQRIDSALYYYNASYRFAQQDSMNDFLPTIENNIAYIYIQQDKLDLADSLLQQVYLKAKETNNHELSSILRNQAELFLKRNQNELAIQKLNEAIEIARKKSNKEIELESIHILIKAFEKTQQFEKAFNQSKVYYQLKEDIKGEEIKKEINRLSFEYHVKEKENEIQILSLENHVQERTLWLQWFFIFILILFSVILFSVYKLRQKKNHIKMLTIQKEISNYVREISILKEHQSHSEEEIKQRIKQWELTEREQDILFYITQGLTNKEIADKIFVSINTVKTHVKNIYVKLDVRNRTEAAQKAK